MFPRYKGHKTKEFFVNIRDRIKELRRVPANELRPNPKNWRKHPEKQLNAIRGILAEVGFAGAELARELDDGTLELIDGHARAEVAGSSEIPVLILDVNESEANKILATFDPIGAMAESDSAILDSVLREVETANEDLSVMIADLAKDAGLYLDDGSSEVVEDEVPEPPSDPITKIGDVWILGRHRLLCGDSSEIETLKKFVGNKQDLLITDPPYGIGYAGSMKLGQTKFRWKQYEGGWDEKRPSDETILNILSFAKNQIVWGGNFFPCLPVSAGWLVWNKVQRNFSMGEGELAWTNFLTSIRMFDLIRAGCISDGKVHPTQKSLKLISWCLSFDDKAESILDVFCGSGTTIIAAEQAKKKCIGVEISPAYCDVIVERWQNLTGEKAKREN